MTANRKSLTSRANDEARRQMEVEGLQASNLKRHNTCVSELLRFRCKNKGCGKEWSSHATQVRVVFTRDGRVKHCGTFKQRCSVCVERGESSPNLNPSTLRKIMARALEQAQRLPRDDAGNRRERRGPPHPPILCELCKWGSTQLH